MVYKAVAEWLTNNWRPKVTAARQASGTLRVSYLRIIYLRHASKMVQLAQKEYNVEEISWSRQPYFGQRLRFAKEVYENMTEAEKEDVQQELRKVQDQGWDPETQKMYVPLFPNSVPGGPELSRVNILTYFQTCRNNWR